MAEPLLLSRAGPFGILVCLLSLLLAACSSETREFQGYIEGEFVRVACPRAGQLVTLAVQRGDWVEAGALLFALEGDPDEAAVREAEAKIRDAEAALELARKKHERAQNLVKTKAMAEQDVDVTEEAFVRAQKQLKATEEAAAQLRWNFEQKHQKAPMAALVHDTYYRMGEWVPAYSPVVSLLPPANIKARFFVPETMVAALQPGDPVELRADGLPAAMTGKISYISPKAEYTPPVIYSNDQRAKLVFLIEAVFPEAESRQLHPGQPVDVTVGIARGSRE